MENLKTYHHQSPFQLESGEQFQNLKIAYHTFGQLNATKSNVIWVFHALTANSNVMDWWAGLFGKNKLFDPQNYFIICANTPGSPYGSSAPKDFHFPLFTVRDICRSFYLLAKHLGIKKIQLAIGGSFGGNQALEFACNFEGSIKHMVLIASSAKESAWSIAIHESQRMALQTDATFGNVEGGKSGLKAARAIGMLTYRTAATFIQTQSDTSDKVSDFKASSYLQYQGDKFVKRFEALPYYYLLKTLDTHDLGRNRGGLNLALNKIKIPTLVIGITTDQLVPTALQKKLSYLLPNAQYRAIDSSFGHDGFLIETAQLDQLIGTFLSSFS